MNRKVLPYELDVFNSCLILVPAASEPFKLGTSNAVPLFGTKPAETNGTKGKDL